MVFKRRLSASAVLLSLNKVSNSFSVAFSFSWSAVVITALVSAITLLICL
ncbi:MAG: hypothetical protein IT251_08770 [Chitinophagaceae bacterium]|nr:hypothetical protein [Chitinophagaceae bacterium]